ncbi:IS630 family transposase [Saccharibacillus sp. CPCC 101409]|uniref:IS630 family transposase n=1 Tax=Saccharibacillus sp. CPCC 101409 TaxID=3058041 RepID=UPI0026718092|nr:IS630 family transposase [Saccharibacillus sp. CPCC 101409]MDO3413274.1 IS630 family transposase [Saccharibacillus sp. CPCC 101409]
MQKRWVVELSQDERTQLEQLIQTGKVAGYKIRHAHMLLQADESELGPSWSDAQIAEAYHTSITTVRNLRKRLVEKGFETALEREKQTNRKMKFDGDTEAKLIALACSEAPEGYSKWSVRMLANRMVECEIVDEISPMTVQRNAKKNQLKPWLKKQWCIPEASGEFVAHMEDVLDVYRRPYDPKRPLICLDETNRQLTLETRPSTPAAPGSPKRVDYEYKRNGVVNLFMMFAPLEAKRYVRVSDTRKRVDFAACIQELVDVQYPDAERIVLVMDNLNTHSLGSLYEAFEPAAAKRLASKLEIHYTPKHGSWLNMAEIEIGVLSRQALSGYVATKADMISRVAAWQSDRNAAQATVDWQFTTQDARIRLKRLYPEI